MPDGIAILLMDESLVSTDEKFFNAIIFNKEQFNVGLRFPLPSLFKQFLHSTKIPSAFLYLNAVRILMGCSILNMLYHLDLSLLEVLFVYTVKMSQKEVFNLSTHIASLQLVTGLPNSTKDATKGHFIVSGPWVASYEHLTHAFEPCRSLGIPGRENCCSLVLSFIIIGLLLTRLIWCIIENMRRSRLVSRWTKLLLIG